MLRCFCSFKIDFDASEKRLRKGAYQEPSAYHSSRLEVRPHKNEARSKDLTKAEHNETPLTDSKIKRSRFQRPVIERPPLYSD
ncbi:hypothetical protein Tco_0631313 [Tanacetum coccineum]